jgi:hypothetical protein
LGRGVGRAGGDEEHAQQTYHQQAGQDEACRARLSLYRFTRLIVAVLEETDRRFLCAVVHHILSLSKPSPGETADCL